MARCVSSHEASTEAMPAADHAEGAHPISRCPPRAVEHSEAGRGKGCLTTISLIYFAHRRYGSPWATSRAEAGGAGAASADLFVDADQSHLRPASASDVPDLQQVQPSIALRPAAALCESEKTSFPKAGSAQVGTHPRAVHGREIRRC